MSPFRGVGAESGWTRQVGAAGALCLRAVVVGTRKGSEGICESRSEKGQKIVTWDYRNRGKHAMRSRQDRRGA